MQETEECICGVEVPAGAPGLCFVCQEALHADFEDLHEQACMGEYNDRPCLVCGEGQRSEVNE